jgi:hypothetical protein
MELCMKLEELGEQWVPESRAALFLGVSPAYLRRDRAGEKLIPYIKIGRTVRYNTEDLKRFAAARREGGKKP